MSETAGSLPVPVLLIRALLVLAVAVQVWLGRIGVPSPVGFLVLGIVLGLLDHR